MLQQEVFVLRRKIIGVLIRTARSQAKMHPQVVAETLGISLEQLTDIELGRRDVSLPQLEALAYLFRVPLSYFWSEKPPETTPQEAALSKAIAVRRRIIGVLLKQARTRAGYSLQDVAEFLGHNPGRISAYESGQSDIPLQELEALAAYLDVSLDYFIDEGLGLAKPAARNGQPPGPEDERLAALSDDVREFVLDPSNQLYLRLAMRLGQLSAETLRALAEGILDITY